VYSSGLHTAAYLIIILIVLQLFIRELKLAILSNLACDSNISSILKEFNAYVTDPNKTFVTQTIQVSYRSVTAAHISPSWRVL